MGKKSRDQIAITICAVVVALSAIGVIATVIAKQSEPEVILNENVVIYDEEKSPFKILSSDTDSVTVTSIEGLSNDTILSSGITPATPSGLLRKLNSYKQVDGGYRIATTPAPLTDAIEKCDITVHATFNKDGSCTIEETGGGNNDIGPLFQSEKAWADIVAGHTFDAQLPFADINAGYGLDIDMRIDFGYIDFSAKLGCGASIELHGFEYEIDDEIASIDLPSFSFYVGPLPVVIDNSLSITAEGKGKCDGINVSGGWSIDKWAGFSYNSNDGLQPILIDESNSEGVKITPTGDVLKINAQFELGTQLSMMIYGLAGPNFSVGLDSHTSLAAKQTDEEGGFQIPGTDMRLAGIFKEKVTLPIAGKFVLKVPFNPFDWNSEPEEIANLELFNTDDAITLLDINEAFGDATIPYVIEGFTGPAAALGRVYDVDREIVEVPSVEISVPLDWEFVSEDTRDYPPDGTTSRTITLTSSSGLELRISLSAGSGTMGRHSEEKMKVLGGTGIDDINVALFTSNNYVTLDYVNADVTESDLFGDLGAMFDKSSSLSANLSIDGELIKDFETIEANPDYRRAYDEAVQILESVKVA